MKVNTFRVTNHGGSNHKTCSQNELHLMCSEFFHLALIIWMNQWLGWTEICSGSQSRSLMMSTTQEHWQLFGAWLSRWAALLCMFTLIIIITILSSHSETHKPPTSAMCLLLAQQLLDQHELILTSHNVLWIEQRKLWLTWLQPAATAGKLGWTGIGQIDQRWGHNASYLPLEKR